MRRIVVATIAMALCWSCAQTPHAWHGEAESREAPADEFVLHSGRIVNSWSPREYEEGNPSATACPQVEISVFLDEDCIWAGSSLGERWQIRNTEKGYDWQALYEVLADYREMPDFAGPPARSDLELAADDEVSYLSILNAMDQALANNFSQLSFVRPRYLSVDFDQRGEGSRND